MDGTGGETQQAVGGRGSGRRRSTRRAMLRGLAATGLLTFSGGTALAVFGERHHPVVRHVSLPLPSLPRELDGLRICHLSDLHRNRWVSEEFIRGAAQMANGLEPDLTVITGDFISGGSHYGPTAARALAGLAARHGVFGVLGNHDLSSGDPDGLREQLLASGVRVLVNSSVPLRHQGREFRLCGVDDPRRGKADLPAALQDGEAGDFRILLCHVPDFADESAASGVPLQLSGHSHGGQVVLPGGIRPVLPEGGRKYPAGLYQVAGSGTRLFTNTGLGVMSLPIRLNCPPEISLLTLRRGA